MTLTKATPISELVCVAGEIRRQDRRVDGVVTAVCTEMGCWLAIGATDNPDQAVRFQAEHDGKIVFPITLKGQQASAEGVFVKIGAGDHEAKEAAGRARAGPAEGGGLRQPLPVPGHGRGRAVGALIDSHCHIAGEEFVADLDAVVERARAAGVSRALVILAAEDDAEIARDREPCSQPGPNADLRSAFIRITPRSFESNPQAAADTVARAA